MVAKVGIAGGVVRVFRGLQGWKMVVVGGGGLKVVEGRRHGAEGLLAATKQYTRVVSKELQPALLLS